MIEVLRQWLVGVSCAALIAAAAQELMPKGSVKQVGRLVCALILLCAVLRPVFSLRLSDTIDSFAGLQAQQEEALLRLQQGSEAILKTHIEQQSEAYILDKADQLGIGCTVQVECAPDDGGLWIPERVHITGALSEKEKEELTGAVQELLGVPPEHQVYTRGE